MFGVMEYWGIGIWEEWGFDATNRERNELCLFPVLHHSNTPTSFDSSQVSIY